MSRAPDEGSANWRNRLITQQHAGARSAPKPAEMGDSDDAARLVSAADILELVTRRLDEEKAEEVVTIELSGKSDVADALVIASGRSQRHVGALADKLSRDLKDLGLGTVKTEGLPACDWVLLDAGDVIVHLFRPEVRAFYNLERIWAPERFAPAG